MFVLDAESGAIRMLMLEEQRPTPEAVLSLLANAMLKPMMGAGGRHRPARILFDDQELAQALRAAIGRDRCHLRLRGYAAGR